MQGRIQKSGRALYRQRWALAAAALGAVTFVLLYGVRVLDPSNVNWLLNSSQDPRQHYLGWEFFRQSPLRLPFWGMNYAVIYPHRASVMYTDSLPLLAALFKPFSRFLPASFQYLGPWCFLSYILQGFWAQKTIARIGHTDGSLVKSLGTLAGAELLVLHPVLLARTLYHTALGTNWLLLAALYLWLRAADPALTTRKACLWWGLMGFVCVHVHAYYLPMVGIILVGFVVRRALARRPAPDLALPIPVYCLAALAALFGLGAFNSNLAAPATYQLWGADLLNLFVPGFVTTPSDNDTDIYIGAGLVLAVALGALITAAAYVFKPHWLELVPATARHWAVSGGVILFLAALVSVSPTVIFAGKTLFSIPLPGVLVGLWSLFRTCGRIAWVLGYLLVSVSCGLLLRLDRPLPAAALLAVCLAVQVAEQKPAMTAKSWSYHSDDFYADPYALTDPGWQIIADSGAIRHVAFSTAFSDSDDVWQICDMAAREHLTVNSFYLTHIDDSLLWSTVAGQTAHLQNDTLYVFIDTEELRWKELPLHYYRLDGILVGTADPLPLPEAVLPDPPTYSLVPAETFAPDEESTMTTLPDGSLQLASGSVSGPGYDLWPGLYEVVLEGSGLDHSYVYSGWHAPNTPFALLDIVWMEGTAERMVFRFHLYPIIRGWSINIHTLDDTPITMTGCTVTRLS